MRLSEVYELDKSAFKYPITGLSSNSGLSSYEFTFKYDLYVSNIVINFIDTETQAQASIKIFIGETLIEESVTNNSYSVSNFKEIAYPQIIFDNLRVVSNVGFTINYYDTKYDLLVKNILIYKYVSHMLNGSPTRYLNIRNGSVLISDKKVNIMYEPYFFKEDDVVIESYSFLSMMEHVWVGKSIIMPVGSRYSYLLLKYNYTDLVPTIILQKEESKTILEKITEICGKDKITISNKSPKEVVERDRKITLDLLKKLRTVNKPIKKHDRDTPRICL